MSRQPGNSIIREYSLYLAWLVALVATASSLYLSEVLLFEPCRLCWFQRIFMYPQVILLGIAAYRDDRSIIRYTLPLNIIGGLIALFHYAEQKIPGLSDIAPCRVGVPCNVDYLDWFGFITIPLMALVAFILIMVFLLIGREKPEEEELLEEDSEYNKAESL
ncbi:disulfide oxidoreductase [Paenibacillus sp. J22TS3]|uniref:disulfide oxidoreductase n=1 Tax=Paenibacillus sp. J22TS3 TaxID=2807192 RepID=UPI001B2BE7E4|nr:disulfide oxidoreductase [Paenibacillus sp. J22TS3]GIP20744.1 disulfide bond formation protein C [Paenibacillus sp. J22TS3]